MVVASSPGAARAFLKTLDHNFSNRPPGAGATHIAYGAQDFVFADIGPRWNLFRKLSNLHMLGAQSYKDWALIREKELGHVIQDMFRLSRNGQPVVVPEMLLCAMANLIGQKSISRRVFATQGSESNEFKYMVVELMRLAGLFNIGDFIPSIAWMDLQGIEGKMKRLHKQFDGLLTKMIEEHSLTAHEREGNPDFLDIVMANREVPDGSELTMTNIKALLLNWYIAGTDTSAGTVEWALAEMIKNPRILKRAQKEMDRVIGRDRRLEESDLLNLPYLQAICKETLRGAQGESRFDAVVVASRSYVLLVLERRMKAERGAVDWVVMTMVEGLGNVAAGAYGMGVANGTVSFYSIPFDFFGDGGDDDVVNSSNPDVEGILPFYKGTDFPILSTLSSVGSSLFVVGGVGLADEGLGEEDEGGEKGSGLGCHDHGGRTLERCGYAGGGRIAIGIAPFKMCFKCWLPGHMEKDCKGRPCCRCRGFGHMGKDCKGISWYTLEGARMLAAVAVNPPY
ncbi:hypothetical protein C3L33_02249, partial [Rhododendron williamsianum]